jgi:hypothetical protein
MGCCQTSRLQGSSQELLWVVQFACGGRYWWVQFGVASSQSSLLVPIGGCKLALQVPSRATQFGGLSWRYAMGGASSPGSGTLQNIGAARFLFRNSMGCCKSMRMYSYSCHRELGRCTLLADTVLCQSNFGAARFPSSYAMGGCFGWCKCMWGMVLAGATLGCWFF